MRCITLVFLLFCSPAWGDIGFFSPQGIFDGFAKKVNFAMFNAASPEQITENLMLAEANGLRVNIDLGPVLADSANPTSLSMQYFTVTGQKKTKLFSPITPAKIRRIPADTALEQKLAPFMDAIAQHTKALDALFLVDEPYLNGVPKSELERASRLVRKMAAERGFEPRIGVTFASAMFNADFAKHIDRNSQLYVEKLDSYRNEVEGTEEGNRWITSVATQRLTTYDTAGNIFTTGGIPAGYDIVSFDFYASTLLFDAIHEDTLQWFAKNTDVASCKQFADTPISVLRERLSFFRDGLIIANAQTIADDAKLMDQLYYCRMDATLDLLHKELLASQHDVDIMLFAESSNNGLFEFDGDGNIEKDQVPILIELRVLQEVNRSISYYNKIASGIAAGLIFFTYQDEFDKSIDLQIGGASNMPLVMKVIEFASKRSQN